MMTSTPLFLPPFTGEVPLFLQRGDGGGALAPMRCCGKLLAYLGCGFAIKFRTGPGGPAPIPPSGYFPHEKWRKEGISKTFMIKPTNLSFLRLHRKGTPKWSRGKWAPLGGRWGAHLLCATEFSFSIIYVSYRAKRPGPHPPCGVLPP